MILNASASGFIALLLLVVQCTADRTQHKHNRRVNGYGEREGLEDDGHDLHLLLSGLLLLTTGHCDVKGNLDANCLKGFRSRRELHRNATREIPTYRSF